MFLPNECRSRSVDMKLSCEGGHRLLHVEFCEDAGIFFFSDMSARTQGFKLSLVACAVAE